MRKIRIIALVGISLSAAFAAPPTYVCTSSQQAACNDANTERTNECNFNGAGQSCYTASVCEYYACMHACGEGDVPQFCSSQ